MKKDLIGLAIIEEHMIKCGDCRTNLAEIVVSETNDGRVARGLSPMKVQIKVVNCYKCGGASFDSKIFEGSTNIHPVNDFTSLEDDGDTDIKNGVLYSTLRMVRN
jgi:hypothetical protein